MSIEITRGRLSVFAVGSVYGEVELLDVAKGFRGVPVPWPADSKVLPGFEPFREPISQGMIYQTKVVNGFHLQLPAPGGLTMDDIYGPLVELKLADRTVLTTWPDASGKDGFGWVEPDGLEITIFGRATGLQAIRDFEWDYRRVDEVAWDEALAAANA